MATERAECPGGHHEQAIAEQLAEGARAFVEEVDLAQSHADVADNASDEDV
jgi:ubiquinone biosynthesis protein UbiJ